MTAVAPAPQLAPDPGIADRAPRRRISPERIAASLTLVALVVASLFALNGIGISIPAIVESWGNAQHFFDRVGHLSFPAPDKLLQLTALTLGIVITGTVLAAVLSVPVAYISASNTSPGPFWQGLGRFIGVFARAVPDAVLAMVFVLVFSIGTLPGIVAIGLHSIGMISKLFADAIEQIDEGPRLAIRAAGGSKWQEFSAGILPQVMPSWVATVLHRNDINLRGSVVLGYVGVAGLGFEMSYAFSSLDYSEGMGIALVIFLLCVVMEIISSTIRAAMLGVAPQGKGLGDRTVRAFSRGRKEEATDAPAPAAATPTAMLRRPWTGTRVRNTVWSWVALAVIVLSVIVCNITWSDLFTVWGKIPPVAAQFWPPEFGAYGADIIVEAMGETILIALAATVLAFAFSLVLGSFAARNVAPNPGVRSTFRLILVAVRGVPEVILAIVLIVVTGLGPQAGTLALAFGGIGLLGKLIADSFEEVARGPERALSATGATRTQVYAAATLPQGTPALIGHTFYLLDSNVRSATILGIVGGGGVGYYLLNAAQGSNYGMITAIVAMMVATVLVIEGIAVWMRRVFK